MDRGRSRTRGAGVFIDTDEACRTGRTLADETPLTAFPRLASMLFDASGTLRWQLACSRVRRPDEGTDSIATLQVTGELGMSCIRCLERVAAPLELERSFKIVSDEVLAEREDPESEDYDVIVGGRRFDLLELVEDESIMALPLAPRHERCELPAMADDESQADEDVVPQERPNPFLALAALRGRAPGGGAAGANEERGDAGVGAGETGAAAQGVCAAEGGATGGTGADPAAPAPRRPRRSGR